MPPSQDGVINRENVYWHTHGFNAELIAVCFWGFDRFRNMIAQSWNFIYSWAELLNLPPQLLLSERRSLHSIGLTQILSNALFPVKFRPFPFLRVFGHVDSPSLTGRQKLSVVCPLVRQFCYEFIGLSFPGLLYGCRNEAKLEST